MWCPTSGSAIAGLGTTPELAMGVQRSTPGETGAGDSVRFLTRRRDPTIRLFVDAAGRDDEPPDRWFRALRDALRAFDALEERWKPFAWIIEYRDQDFVGGIPTVRNIVHLSYGQPATGEDLRRSGEA
jgi:hypothetical protein